MIQLLGSFPRMVLISSYMQDGILRIIAIAYLQCQNGLLLDSRERKRSPALMTIVIASQVTVNPSGNGPCLQSLKVSTACQWLCCLGLTYPACSVIPPMPCSRLHELLREGQMLHCWATGKYFLWQVKDDYLVGSDLPCFTFHKAVHLFLPRK